MSTITWPARAINTRVLSTKMQIKTTCVDRSRPRAPNETENWFKRPWTILMMSSDFLVAQQTNPASLTEQTTQWTRSRSKHWDPRCFRVDKCRRRKATQRARTPNLASLITTTSSSSSSSHKTLLAVSLAAQWEKASNWKEDAQCPIDPWSITRASISCIDAHQPEEWCKDRTLWRLHQQWSQNRHTDSHQDSATKHAISTTQWSRWNNLPSPGLSRARWHRSREVSAYIFASNQRSRSKCRKSVSSKWR